MTQCRLLKVFRFWLRAGDQRPSDYLPALLCILAENTILSALHISGDFLLQLRKKKSGIYQTSTVHAKHMSISIRIYVQRYLYLYLSFYSYRYRLHCTYFFFFFVHVCLACAPCKNCMDAFVCHCVCDSVPGCMFHHRR